ncbi:MAG: 3-ketoacyl-ACP reductase, partial [Chloroflexi bacterium]|nr:3-ketoacyl-ACP reductase [Chloroflexota bacterium]
MPAITPCGHSRAPQSRRPERGQAVSVRDKSVIITGAAQGHGRSIANAFASEGAQLALVDIAPMDQVISECKAYEVEVLEIPTDLREPDRVRALVEQVHQRYGKIDVLINDAGIVPHFRYGVTPWPKIADMEPDFFDNVIRTNLFGTFLTTKFTLPHMQAQGSGHIINFGQGRIGRGPSTGTVGSAVYDVSKMAIRAFTQSVAAEVKANGICVMSFGPGGPGATEGYDLDSLPPEQVRALAAEI